MTDTVTSSATDRLLPVAVREVQIDDAFWSPRQRQLRQTTLHAQYEQLEKTGRLGAFRLTWTPDSDEPQPHPFWESDIAKWLEAASYVLAVEPDAGLESKVDEAIALLAGAQQPDGYLNAYFTTVKPGERFTDLRDAHELYGAGHLIEAGVAHHEATGKTSLLDIVTRYADLLVSEFGEGGPREGGYCGHEEVELALVRLYRTTGKERYVRLAKKFVDERGTEPHYFQREQEQRGHRGIFSAFLPTEEPARTKRLEYHQAHRPVREQDEVVGHAVRAVYLYSAMADLAAETEDQALAEACTTLWEHLTTKRMYVTAGIGDSAHNEGFTYDYALPNYSAYAETCASIGLIMWANRMSSLHGYTRYLDVLERALYNGVIAGVSADGQRFFYDNPLASDGHVERKDWFECACCPPNLARLEASLGSYIYAAAADQVAVNLYIGSALEREVAGTQIRLQQQVSGAVAERVDVRIGTAQPARWTLRLRVPDWADAVRVRVNGGAVDAGRDEQGYLSLSRTWNDADQVQLTFDVAVRTVHANPAVSADAGRAALTYGPFVYCVEGVDISVPAHTVVLTSGAPFPESTDDTATPPRLRGRASADSGWSDEHVLYSTQVPGRGDIDLVAVPYYSWNNRGRSSMAVWLQRS